MGRIGYCREHIIDAGLKVLLHKGYNGAGVKEIVEAAGVPKGSFYNHFTSKEAFVIEAIQKVANENMAHAKQILRDHAVSPKQRLLNYFSGNCEQITDEEYCGGCLIGNLCLEMADENTAIRETTSNIMCQQIELIANCLEEAKSAGELAVATNVEELAEFMYYAWEGAIMRVKGLRSCHPFNVFKNQLHLFFN